MPVIGEIQFLPHVQLLVRFQPTEQENHHRKKAYEKLSIQPLQSPSHNEIVSCGTSRCHRHFLVTALLVLLESWSSHSQSEPAFGVNSCKGRLISLLLRFWAPYLQLAVIHLDGGGFVWSRCCVPFVIFPFLPVVSCSLACLVSHSSYCFCGDA